MANEKDTRRALLNTALQLLWSQNYSSTSVDAICRAAGVRKGSFYHYFVSKADLAVAALEKSWDDVQAQLDQVFSPQRAPLERLRLFIEFERELQAQEKARCGYVIGCPYTTLGSEQCHCDDGIRSKACELLGRLKRYFVAALRDAQLDGELGIHDTGKCADDLFTFFLGVIAQARVSNSLEPFDRCYECFLALLGVRKPDSPRIASGRHDAERQCCLSDSAGSTAEAPDILRPGISAGDPSRTALL